MLVVYVADKTLQTSLNILNHDLQFRVILREREKEKEKKTDGLQETVRYILSKRETHTHTEREKEGEG